MLPLPPSLFRRRAFTLVEVVIALGIVSFSLVAILGAFAAGMDTMRRGIEQTTSALISSSVASEFRSDGIVGNGAGLITLYFSQDGVAISREETGGYTAIITPLEEGAAGESWRLDVFPGLQRERPLFTSRLTAPSESL